MMRALGYLKRNPVSLVGVLLLAAFVRDRWPPIKIIVTSGHRMLEGGRLPVEGAFLPKPYRAEAVIASILALIG